MPGLRRGAARTAVIAGTATTVSNSCFPAPGRQMGSRMPKRMHNSNRPRHLRRLLPPAEEWTTASPSWKSSASSRRRAC